MTYAPLLNADSGTQPDCLVRKFLHLNSIAIILSNQTEGSYSSIEHHYQKCGMKVEMVKKSYGNL